MLARLRQQATVLEAVNTYTGGPYMLAGLSLAAISDWAARNPGPATREVQTLLEQAAKVIGCLHDRSNPPAGTEGPLPIDSYIRSIHQRMANTAIHQDGGCAAAGDRPNR